MTELKVQPGRAGEAVTVGLEGELDLSNIVEVGDEISALVDHDSVGLVLDLSAVRYVDSAGVRMLFEIARRLMASRQGMALVLPEDSPVRSLVAVTNLGEVATCSPSVDEAVSLLQGTAHERR